MTTARIKRTGRSLSIAVSGHAGYGPRGSDIVCAAVSMLVQTLAASLAQEEKKGGLKQYRCQMGDGSIEIQADVLPRNRQAIDGMINMTAIGFRLLEEQYPSYVSVHLDNRPP